MMYHPDLNTNSKDIPIPKGRARIYRRGRCHGNWAHSAIDGNSNFTDIRIDYKSKVIGKELGITWNKAISKEQSNDLCIALRKLVEKIRNELNGNTSTTKNKELYNLALKNNIKVPDQRRPTDIKKIDKHGIPLIKIQEIKELPKKEEPKPTVLDCLSNIPKVNIPLVILDDNDEIIIETKTPTIVVPHVEAKLEAKVPAIVVPHVEAKLEAKVPTIVVPHVEAKLEAKTPANVELVMEDVNNDIPDTKNETISDVVPENNVIKPQVTNISETVHTTITVVEGKRILNKLKNCDDVSNDDIDKIIVLYCDRCAKDQISMALKYMTISKKLEFLDEMIFLKYRFCNDDKTEILGGSKLNTIFRNLEKK